MDKDRRIFWLFLIAAAIVIGMLAITCAGGTGSQVAHAAERSDDDSVIPPPQDFTVQATRIQDTRCKCWVWAWDSEWQVKNIVGRVQYRFKIDVQWRAAADQSKVTGLVFNYCLDTGGYFAFDGCKKQRGDFGYRTLGMYTVWHYHFGVPSVGAVQRDPSVRFSLAANGYVTGTVYYDN